MVETATPRAAHRLTIEPAGRRVVVRFGGRTIADTTRAVTLREGNMPPVVYVPREDADMSLLERTARRTHCPFKGDASYYSIRTGGADVAESAVWTYEQPLPGAEAIRDHLAFYTDRVELADG